MKTMGLDLEDDSLKGSPDRVAKMYIDEIFSGLNPKNKPKVSLFENKYEYDEIVKYLLELMLPIWGYGVLMLERQCDIEIHLEEKTYKSSTIFLQSSHIP